MTRRENRPNAAQLRLLNRYQRRTEAIALSRFIGERVARGTWFKAPATPSLTVGRVAEIHDVPQSMLERQVGMYDAVQRGQNEPLPGTYEWAKAHAHESATAYVGLNLHRPSSTLNHRTVRFAGKPYHFRQDYTGQLKLAAGESPW